MYTIYFSYTPQNPIEPSEWLNQAIEQAQAIYDAESAQLESIHLELPVSRLGFKGVLQDNPSIDLIDHLQQEASAKQHSIAALHLPIDFPHEEVIGAEISAVNGWTDMACYMGLDIIRVNLPEKVILSASEQNYFAELIDYILEMDIQVAITAPKVIDSTLENLIQNQWGTSDGRIGWNIQIEWAKEKDWINQLSVQQNISTVAIKLSNSIEDISLETICDHLTYQFPHSTPSVFLEMANR